VLPNDPFYGNYYYQYPAIIEGIRETAAAHGFDGEYWATEITYCSEEFPHCHAPDQPWGLPRTDKQAAKYSARAIVMHLGWDIGVAMLTWLPDVREMAPWTHPTTSNLYKVLAGTMPISLDVRIEREPTNTLTNTFELPNGDMLFALWTHGEAVDDDPGVITTLTFPGLSAQQVIAIDVLNGFEQELIIEVSTGNLVIRNIFVRDYPLILRITNRSVTPPLFRVVTTTSLTTETLTETATSTFLTTAVSRETVSKTETAFRESTQYMTYTTSMPYTTTDVATTTVVEGVGVDNVALSALAFVVGLAVGAAAIIVVRRKGPRSRS